MRKNEQQHAVLVRGKVPAGFPSPAADYREEPLDLNKLLVTRPSATFFVRAQGDSMTGAGIFDNDLLIVDRSRKPTSGNVVVAIIDGEFTVKRLVISANQAVLTPENKSYQAIVIDSDSDAEIWGVVTYAIHKTS